MAVHVVWNTLRDPLKHAAARTAVLEGLGPRPEQEHWDVKLTESGALPGWIAVIVCPNKSKVAWHFRPPLGDDSPPFVRSKVVELLKTVGY